MKKKTVFYLLVIIFLSTPGATEPAFLTNGDAETGNTSGWDNPTKKATSIGDIKIIQAVVNPQGNIVTPAERSNDFVDPYEGTYFFSFSEQSIGVDNSVFMAQTGAIDQNVDRITLSGYYATLLQDFGNVGLYLYDSENNLVDSIVSDPLNTGSTNENNWIPFDISIDVPANAVEWKIVLSATVKDGSFANVYMDYVELTSGPSNKQSAFIPTIMLLLD